MNTNLPTNKLILLYFIEKTGAAVSNSQITQFTLEYAYMDYFTLHQSIQELLEANYLMKTVQNKRILYYITDDGVEALSFFHHIIPEAAKKNVNNYLILNKKKIKAALDASANYFPTDNGEYLIKCALIEGNGDMLMEITLATANKERAKMVCENWKNDTGTYYSAITKMLFGEAEKENAAEPKNAAPNE